MRDQSARGNASKEDVTSKAQSVGAHWGIFVLIATNYTQVRAVLLLVLAPRPHCVVLRLTSRFRGVSVAYACSLIWSWCCRTCCSVRACVGYVRRAASCHHHGSHSVCHSTAESTVGCDYVTSMAQLRTVQFACMLAWRPISGYLTDATAQIADWVLLAAATLELVTLLALMLLPIIWGRGGYSVWIVLALQLAKAMIEIQVYNSVWKIVRSLWFSYQARCAVLTVGAVPSSR